MSRWTAESDMDYADEVERSSLKAPIHRALCFACGKRLQVARDAIYPYRCESCHEDQRNDATGHSHEAA